jgi:signal transduction histidine kinase
MNSVSSPLSTRRILRYVEWGFIALSLVFAWINSDYGTSGDPSWQLLALLIAFSALSLIFPVEASFWIRQTYILAGILLMLVANAMGFGFEFFLYLYIVKGCFLLNRQSILMTTIVAVAAVVVVSIWAMPVIVQVQPFWNIDPANPKHVVQFVAGILLNHIAASTFVIPLSFMVLAERQSRQRAETLTQQVEDLVTALERTRIARDIHDSLGHSLTALRIHLSVAQKALLSNPAEALQAVNTAKLLANQSIEEIQQTVRTLRYPNFDLTQALVRLMEQLLQFPSLSTHWNINLPSLPLQTSHHLYYIVREGLINIQKHAEASMIHLDGYATTNEVRLELRDNGRGFDPHQPHVGFGLKGIAERVQLLRGNLEIHSAAGQGTQIQIVIPR